MKRIFISLLVLFGIAAGGVYFYYSNALAPEAVPATVMNAEEAVATSGTIAIAGVDMTYVRRINDVLSGEKDPSPLHERKATEAKPADTVLAKLDQLGVDLYSDTDYALTTINVSHAKPAYTFVLLGRFTPDKIKQTIRQYYRVEESSEAYWLIEALPEQAKASDPCAEKKSSTKKSAPLKQALHLQNNRIILSSPALMPILLKRFAENASADIALGKWRAFRKDKVVAGAFMTPKQAKKGAVDLPSALLLGAVSEQPLEDIYAGAVVGLLPSPGMTLLVDFHASEAAWPLEIKTRYDAWLSETVDDLKEMPTLASLVQDLNVQADGDILRLSTMADSTTVANLEKVPGEFLQMVFSQASVETSMDEPAGAEKTVKNEDIEKYAPGFDFSSIKPFENKSVFHAPDHVVGPIGVRLERFGLFATDDSIIELKIKAEGKGFDNVSGDHMHQSNVSPSASLLITSIEDKEGNSLLREELCGKTRNLAAESLSTIRDKEYVDGKWYAKSIKVSGSKTVRLKPNVPISSVARINGKVAIRAATRTRTQTLQTPFTGKAIETDKVRMYLKKSHPRTVKYQLSGDMSRVLAVRAKNANGQYLADGGSSGLGGEGAKTISKRFKGNVASIEVVVAEQMASKEYPFVIDKIVPRYGKQSTKAPLAMTHTSKQAFLSQYAKVEHKGACKDRQTIPLGGFLVCLKSFAERWGRETGGEFEVHGPVADVLRNDLAAAVLSIDTVLTESGEEIAFDKNANVAFDYTFVSRYDGKKWVNTNKRFNDTYVKVYTDKEELKDKKVKLLKGNLTVRIPKRPDYFELDADELGVTKQTKNGIIANISAFEDWSTYIDLQGPVDKVMRFMPIAKDGTILTTGNDRINEKQYHTWGMSKQDKEKIKALPKKWQGMITIYGKPEVIRVYYADEFDVIKYPFKFTLN